MSIVYNTKRCIHFRLRSHHIFWYVFMLSCKATHIYAVCTYFYMWNFFLYYRLYLINSPVVRADTLKFQEKGVKDIIKDVFLPWFNAHRFLLQNIQQYEKVCFELILTSKLRFSQKAVFFAPFLDMLVSFSTCLSFRNGRKFF